ncbi:methyl-accepting chemotaxis protein [Comamonas aquatica]|uniref:methyl-accepting chemotaxis protein n=1 Tax=Comamonas aquatica TaxID=225991 RepID=UPI003D00E553
MSYGNWPIGRKLAAVLGIILLLFVSSSGLAIYQSLQQDRMLSHMMDEVLVTERALKNWSMNVTAGVQRAAAIAKSDDASLVQYFDKATKEATADTAVQMKIINAHLRDPAQLALLEKSSKLRDAYLAQRKEIAALKAAGNAEGAHRVFTQQFEPTMTAYLQSVADLADAQRALFDQLSAQSRQSRTASMWQLGVFTSVALALGLLFAVLATRSITRPLHLAQQAAREVAALDLSGTPQAHYHSDETGQLLRSLDEMRSTLNRTMGQVLQSAQSISTASEEVASGSNDLSSRTETTAANLEQSASAIEQLSSSAQQCTEATRQAEALTRNSSLATQQGYDKTQHVQQTMEQIHASSRKIGDIIGVIDGIAFQTNILALNAAVEAARAGEQGRGFAVVAGEVRTLAQRSATAAKEIRQLIDTNLHSVSAGTAQVHDASQAMQAILDNVTRVQDIVAEVNAATNEQSQGAAQVNQAIAQLDQMTQQNAALVEESNAAAAHLHAQASQLRQVVEAFKLSQQPTAQRAPTLPRSREPALLSG